MTYLLSSRLTYIGVGSALLLRGAGGGSSVGGLRALYMCTVVVSDGWSWFHS